MFETVVDQNFNTAHHMIAKEMIFSCSIYIF